MSLTTLNENLNIIAALSDEPTLSAAELKAKFDEGAIKIKTYLNDTLTAELDTITANIPEVTDNLLSTDSAKALSAKQGKILKTLADTKQDIITGAALSLTSEDLSANRALISNENGKVAVAEASATELSYLINVSSNIQAQLNAKQKTITSGTAAPSGGNDGDIYLRYEA